MKRSPSIRDLERRNDPKVTILPTAARRQVQQQWNRDTRDERARLRRENPWPGEHLHPHHRAAIKHARTSQSVQRTPGLLLAMALAITADGEARAKVENLLAASAAAGCTASQGALAMLRIHPRTIGEQVDVDFAWRYLDQEEQP